MKNEIYIINKQNTDIEYIILKEENAFILKRSNSREWASDVRDTVILTIKDTGSGYKVKWEEKTGKELDYSQAIELTVMLNYLNQHASLPMNYEIIDANKVDQLM